MSRTSKILMAVTVSLGFIGGCSSSGDRPPLFWRFRSQGPEVQNGETVASEGPVLDSNSPTTLPPSRPTMLNPQPTAPNCGPTPAPVPRLQPQPQAQQRPYVPQ